MIYSQLINLLDSTDIDRVYPIVIPSVFRPAHATHKYIVLKLPRVLRKRVFYVIREDQEELYKANQPGCNYLIIPNKICQKPGFGLDSTRAWYHRKMREIGYTKILEFDDDLTGASMVYQVPETHTTRRLVKNDRDRLQGNILALACIVADWWFREHSDACLGGFCRVRPETCKWEYGDRLISAYCEGSVGGFMVTYLSRLHEIGALHTGKYDPHSEDIGYNIDILNHGGSIFKMNPFIMNMLPADNQERTEPLVQKQIGDEKTLCSIGYSTALKYTDCIKVTQRFDDGSPRFFTIDWRKWNKQHGTQPIVKAWKDFLES